MKTIEKQQIKQHNHCINNKIELTDSTHCGCFSCCKIFNPTKITKWISRGKFIKTTALCPFCKVDAIIGSASGYNITPEFLQKMYDYWFNI